MTITLVLIIAMCALAVLMIIDIAVDFRRGNKVWCLMSKDGAGNYALHGVFSSAEAAECHTREHGGSEWAILEAKIDVAGAGGHVKFVRHTTSLDGNI